MKELTHRDEIHGDVEYDRLSVALLDTPTLQRLGRVYQLGYGHLVYRGGTHTRLSHSMGTSATAARLVDALRQNYERRSKRPRGALAEDDFLPRPSAGAAKEGRAAELRLDIAEPSSRTDDLADRWSVLRHLVRWAALLHDIGHVPLGHTLEDEFENIYQRHDEFSSPRLSHLWLGADGNDSDVRVVLMRRELYPPAFQRLGITHGEDVWAAVLLTCVWKEEIDEGKRTSFQEILNAAIKKQGAGKRLPFAERLLAEMKRLNRSMFSPYMADLVANTISADYLDYLRRDPHNLGLNVLEDDRVVSHFWVGKDHLGQARMALSLEDRRGKPRLDTCTGVVELVRQRYRFAEIVYYHKTKVAASAMLAKVFQLTGSPPEIPAPRETPTLEQADAIARELIAATGAERAKQLRELETSLTPVALLDPEIGDESLAMVLRAGALDSLAKAVKAGDHSKATNALRSIALLDALARRKLFKVVFSMNAEQFRALSGSSRSTPRQEVERLLRELIKRLRSDAEARAKTEAKMVAAASGWPTESLLLYVPPRKSQAKGIETGALADECVVTLGAHPAVEDAVQDLSNHYAGLWRLIVLVSPEQSSEVVGLSDGIDAFVAEQFPTSDMQKPATVAAIEDCCWFGYIRADMRAAARLYGELSAAAARQPQPRERLMEFDKLIRGRPSDEELAIGACLIDELEARADGGSHGPRLKQFARPGALLKRIDALRDQMATTAPREGEHDSDDSHETAMAIRALADELCR